MNAVHLISSYQSPEERREKDPTPADLLYLKSSSRLAKDLHQNNHGFQEEGGEDEEEDSGKEAAQKVRPKITWDILLRLMSPRENSDALFGHFSV